MKGGFIIKKLRLLYTKISKYKIDFIIFCSNFIYMTIELLASRIISPYVCSSNDVWTAVIGVIILSGCIGNYLGGLLSDKNNHYIKMQKILLFAGFWLACIPFFQFFVLNPTSFFEVRFSNNILLVLIMVTALFFIPTMAISMLSPIGMKTKITQNNQSGKAVGSLYAISALGSITGTFVSGYLLIPKFGSIQIVSISALALIALTFLLCKKKNIEQILYSSIIFIIVLGFTGYHICYQYNAAKDVISNVQASYVDYDTEYGRVYIQNTNKNNSNIRRMIVGNGHESATYTNENEKYELVYEYTKYYDLMFKANIDIKNTLMIGGAGYSYPKYYMSHYPDKNMDVIEIDNKITQLAKKYFFLDDLYDDYNLNKNNFNIYNEDGRTFLNKNTKKYDAILNDAYTGENPAETLVTQEAIKNIKNSLNKNGVFLSNTISAIDGTNSLFLKSVVKTIKSEFNYVYIVPCELKYQLNTVQNVMIIASDSKLDIDNTVEIDLDDGVLLTDNYHPVNSLLPKD